ncbi:type IV secretion protein Rhs [Fulvitalea axinellae]|uniref:Type IV secretion protein Rhs n=1 Tax=Fulvitalea axinellae TaxID=1182444 RepID=A0AAU9CPY3_9BACT|nr:type IV secretion protein Rhs [Fulvitalea axinellae]
MGAPGQTTYTEVDGLTVKVAVNKQELDESYQLESLQVDRQLSKLTTAKIILVDGKTQDEDFLMSSDDTFEVGGAVTVSAGYQNTADTIFDGIITGHRIKTRKTGGKVSSQLVLHCRLKSTVLVNGRKNITYPEMKDSDVMMDILSAHGLKGQIDATSTKHPSITQHNVSDWDFIRKRAWMNGLVVEDDETGIIITAPSFEAEEGKVLDYGMNIIGFDVEIDSVHQVDSVEGASWDPKQMAPVKATGTDPGYSFPGELDASSLAEVSDDEGTGFASSYYAESGEVKAWSDAMFAFSRMAAVVGRISFPGDSTFEVNTAVTLSGFGDRFNGPVFISGVKHVVRGGQWITELALGDINPMIGQSHPSLEDPYVLVPGVSGLHMGKVKKLASDPLGQSRLLIDCPAVDPDGEGVWSRLATFYASSSHGAQFIPEVGDEVVLGFVGDDPRFPIILGSLYGKKNAPPFSISAQNAQKGFVTPKDFKVVVDEQSKKLTAETPGGNVVELDDMMKQMELTDPNGNSVKLSKEGVTITSAKDVTIDASKGKLTFSCMSDVSVSTEIGDVSLDGMNIKQSAKLQWQAESSAIGELKATGPLTIEGAVVSIN